jgi:multidrug resistance efflux pump
VTRALRTIGGAAAPDRCPWKVNGGSCARISPLARATLTSANLRLGYTRIIAPFDGGGGERQVQEAGHVNVARNLIAVVPLPDVYVDGQLQGDPLTRVAPGQRVDVRDRQCFPARLLRARVARLSPASGSTFALLPPDNATGNFTKVAAALPCASSSSPASRWSNGCGRACRW